MHTGIRLVIGERKPAETMPSRPFVSSDRALLCGQCPAIYEADGQPCPRCGSRSGWPLLKWLDRRTIDAGRQEYPE